MRRLLEGLVAAVFTPLKADGSLDLGRIPALVDHLEGDGVAGLYVLGSTGEGVSFTGAERRAVAEAYVAAARGRLPVVVQVGHDSLAEARAFAAHAAEIGADAVSAMPPTYFKPETLEALVDCMAEIAAGAPGLPFYYYHIPVRTGVALNMEAFLRLGAERLPTLAGLKFSDTRLHDLQACLTLLDGRYEVLFGVDEMMLGAYCTGVRGFVGSTYNFAAPLYRRLIDCFEAGDVDEARRLQGLSMRMVQAILGLGGGVGGLKATMGLIGHDCGPHRLPLRTPAPDARAAMQEALDALGFFEWGRSYTARPIEGPASPTNA